MDQLNQKTVSEAIAHRRSVRHYDPDRALDSSLVEQCLEQAHLAPTSSNMQLWEFYRVESSQIKSQIAAACFNQPAAKTAQQLVVVVVRKDLWKSRAKANVKYLQASFAAAENVDERRKKMALNYYQKLIPTLYGDFLGILGGLKFIGTQITGIFRPIYRQVRKSDMRVVAHKSAGLAAQNFMLSMAAYGMDTCPMEGFDSLRVKKALGLPRSAQINMVIGCGYRTEKGVYGNRFRVPFSEVYKAV